MPLTLINTPQGLLPSSLGQMLPLLRVDNAFMCFTDFFVPDVETCRPSGLVSPLRERGQEGSEPWFALSQALA